MKKPIKYSNKYDYETEDQMREECAKTAIRFADKVIDREASLLYDKLLKFRVKYGTYPGTKNILRICFQLNTDIIRKNGRKRKKNGVLKGSGVDHPVVSIHTEVGESNCITYEDAIMDNNDNPSDILSKSMDEFLNILDDRTKSIIKNKCENATFQEIGNELKITRQRVEQIYKVGLSKLKELSHELK